MWGGSRLPREGVTSEDAGQESRLTELTRLRSQYDDNQNTEYSVCYCDLSTYQLAALQ